MEKKKSTRRKVCKVDTSVPFFKTFDKCSSWLAYVPNFLSKEEAKIYYDELSQVDFKPEKKMFGHSARQVKWFGDFDYKYSNSTKEACKAPAFVNLMAQKVSEEANKYQALANETRKNILLAKKEAIEKYSLETEVNKIEDLINICALN